MTLGIDSACCSAQALDRTAVRQQPGLGGDQVASEVLVRPVRDLKPGRLPGGYSFNRAGQFLLVP